MRVFTASALVVVSVFANGPAAAARSASHQAPPSGPSTGCMADAGQQPDTVAANRAAARQIPLGEKVTVRTMTGQKLSGRLRAAGETGVIIEKPTRYPVAPVEVSYDAMQSIEQGGRMGWGKRSAIIAAIGGVAFLIVFAATFGCAGC